jgi:hypothetical protein
MRHDIEPNPGDQVAEMSFRLWLKQQLRWAGPLLVNVHDYADAQAVAIPARMSLNVCIWIRSPESGLSPSAQSGPNPSKRRLGFEPISLRPTPDGAAPPPAAVAWIVASAPDRYQNARRGPNTIEFSAL